MKTLSKLLTIIMFFSVTESLLAQKKTPAEILGIKVLKQKTVKAKSNEYKIKVFEKRYYIDNIKSVYENANANYTVGEDEYLPFTHLSDEDWVKLKQFTTDLIGEYVFKTPKTWECADCIYIWMTSDMQGNVKDVSFSLPNAVSIPIEVIEQLETFVRKEMKLLFKIDHTNQNANYMYRDYGVQFEPMRKAREAKVQ